MCAFKARVGMSIADVALYKTRIRISTSYTVCARPCSFVFLGLRLSILLNAEQLKNTMCSVSEAPFFKL